MKFKFKGNTNGLADLQGVPTQFHCMYTKDEETEEYSIPEGFGGVTGAIDALNKANIAIRAEADDAKKQVVSLDPLAEYGETPDAILEAFTERLGSLNALVEKNSQVNVEKIREETGKSFHATIEGLQGEKTALTSQLHTMLVRDKLSSGISEAEGNAKLLLPHLEPYIKVHPDDQGKLEVRIYDEDGDLRMSPATGGNMTIPELVHSTKADPEYSSLFQSKQKSGGGSNPVVGQGGPKKGPGTLSSDEKMRLGLEARLGR